MASKMKAMYPIFLPKSGGSDNERNAENINQQHLNANFQALLEGLLKLLDTCDTAFEAIGLKVSRAKNGYIVTGSITTRAVDDLGNVLKTLLSGGELRFYVDDVEAASIGRGADNDGGYITLRHEGTMRLDLEASTGCMTVYDTNGMAVAYYGEHMILGENELTPAKLGELIGLKKSLWSGSWSSGDITVDGIRNYSTFLVKMSGQGTNIIASIGGANGESFHGIGGCATSGTSATTYYLAATLSDNTLSMGYCRSVTSSGTRTDQTITEIIGLM